MRGWDERSGSLFSYVDLEARVGKDHPIRIIRGVVNEALAALSGEFSALYSRSGRPSIPPEKLLRAMLLQAFYSIRSERQLMERLEFDLLFRWFVGVGVDDAAWDHSTFSKNRERLLQGDIAAKLLSAVMAQPRVKRLLSTDHFSVDGTLVEAWASMKSFRPKDGSGDPPTAGGGRNREADFHGQKRSNETHASTTDPDAHLYRKGPGKEANTITVQGGEIAFGALEAGLEVEYARDSIGFHWAGCEEGDEVEGEGTAELLDDGTIEIEFAYRNGDEAVLKAKRDPSSTG